MTPSGQPRPQPVRRRSLLALTTAMGGLLAGPAFAQTPPAPRLPTAADVVRTDPSLPGLRPQVAGDGSALDVRLFARNTVIDWNGFNIPEGLEANFRDGVGANLDMAVLNRDVNAGGAVSQLLGRLNSDPNVAVWVYNPNGILVGANAAFNAGSLVLTTLDVDQSDFRSGGRNFRLTGPAASQAAITVMNGAQIRVEGGTRGLVMVAPRIDADGAFEAVGQDVAFVTATDVTLTYNPGSPLSITLNRGTAVPGRSQYVRGSVEGADALFALASQGTVTDALLQVDASVTTALAGTRGVVLSAGKPASAVAGVTVGGQPADTGGVASLRVEGALTTTDTDGGSDILAAATGSAAFTGALSTRRDVRIAAGGALEVAGAVSADGVYSLAGRGVALGGSLPVEQAAGGAVEVAATDGDIVGRAGLTLRSGGTAEIALTTAGSVAGDLRFDPGTAIRPGADRGGALTLRPRDPSNVVVLGDVSARSLRGPAANGLTLGSALTLGDVDVAEDLLLNAAGISAGALTSDGAVSLTANGALAAAAVTARGGSATLAGSGDATVVGTVAALGQSADVVVTQGGAIALGGATAARDVRIGDGAPAASAAVGGPVTAGRDYVVTASAVTLGGDAAVDQRASGAVSVTAGAGGITGRAGLTLVANADGVGGEALTLAIDPAQAGAGAVIAFEPDTALLGGRGLQSDVRVRSADAGGAVTLGRVAADRLLGAVGSDAFTNGLSRTAALRTGDVLTRDAVVLRGASVEAGVLASNEGGVTVEAATGALALGGARAAGSVLADAARALTIGGDMAAGGALTLRGASVAFAGGQASSGGAIDVLARADGIASTGPLAVSSSSARAGDFVRLQTMGPDGIALAPGSSIVAGADRALRVAVFNGSPDAPLALGDVAARSLGALAALNGDPTAPAGAITTGGSLRFGALDLLDGFAAESTGGDLAVRQVTVTGTGQGISLRAAGALDLQGDVAASGDVTLASGAALSLGSVESRDGRATVSSGGALRLGTLAGALGVSATGASLQVDVARGGPVALAATAGDAAIGAVSGADVSLSAAGDLAATGGVAATGSVAITGRSVTLGGEQRVGGAYAATATDGGITGEPGLLIASDADGVGGEALTLSATGGAIALDPATPLLGGVDRSAAVLLRTDGGGVAVGRVAAASLTVAGATLEDAAIRTGDLSLRDGVALSAKAGVATGAIAVDAGGVAVDAGLGTASVGAVAAPGAVSLAGGAIRFARVEASGLDAAARTGDLAGGDVLVGRSARIAAAGGVELGRVAATGDDVELDAGGRLFAASVEAGGAASLRTRGTGADLLVAGGVSAGRSVAVAAAGSFRAPFLRSRTGDLTVSAGGEATGFDPAGALALDAGGVLSLTAVGTARLGDVSGGAVALAAASVGAGQIGARSGAAALRSTGGDLSIASVSATGDVDLAATGAARIAGAVAAGGAYRATGGSVALGGAGTVQRAGGELRITTTSGDIAGGAGLLLVSDADASGGEPLILDAAGGIALAGVRLQARPGGGAALGLRAGGGRAVRLGAIEAGLVGGFDGTGVTGAFAHSGAFEAGDVVATDMAVALSAGDLATGAVTASGALSLRAATGAVATGALRAGALELAAGGALSTGGITVAGAATLAGGAVTTGDMSAALLAVRTGGTLAGRDGARPALTTTAGDLTIEAGAARLGPASSAGDLSIDAGSLDVAGRLAAARQLLAVAREALTAGDALAGGAMTLRAGGALAAGALDAAGPISVAGGGVAVGSARSGGALSLRSGRDLSLGGGVAPGGIAVEAAGLATLGALSGGPSIAIAAGDAALGGAVSAAAVSFTNVASATGAMRLGDDLAMGGFALSAAEVNRVAADSVRFDGGTGALEVGTLALASTAGRGVELVSAGDVRVTGVFSSTAAGRSILIGGPGGTNAASIQMIATGGAGGRLLVQEADLALRADRIAVGLGPGFIDTLGADQAGRAQAAGLIGNGNSPLYNAQLGGGFFDPGAATTLAARSLTLHFADYALFQNTGLPGRFSGVVLGGTPAAPVTPALRVVGAGAGAAPSFALFGVLNGTQGSSAALLGAPVIDIDPSLLPSSRINGCLAGSGAGCLTTIVIQPTLQVFEWDSEDVFGLSQDVAVPFAPVVSGNNESLLGGLPELAPQQPLQETSQP